MALKLFQDHFIDSDQFEDLSVLYESSTQALSDTVVAYEVCHKPAARFTVHNLLSSVFYVDII